MPMCVGSDLEGTRVIATIKYDEKYGAVSPAAQRRGSHFRLERKKNNMCGSLLWHISGGYFGPKKVVQKRMAIQSFILDSVWLVEGTPVRPIKNIYFDS